MAIDIEKNKVLGYSIMASFVVLVSTNYIMVVQMQMTEVTTKQGVETYFMHPVFQANAGIVCELVLVNMIALPYLTYSRQQPWFTYKSSPMVFFWPALCDYCDKMFVTIGMLYLSASLPVMIRGLVPPITGTLSWILFGMHFSTVKIVAIVLTITGVAIGCFV